MNDTDDNKYSLILNNETFFIPKDIREIDKVSEKINRDLVENGKYIITSNVQNSVFKSFLDYWQNEKLPIIDSNTINEYRQLIDEFGILYELLSQSEVETSDDIYYGKKKKAENQQIFTDFHEI